MKFPKPNITTVKNLHIESLKNGLTSNKTADGLESCINVWYQDGALKTRDGIKSSPLNCVGSEDYSGGKGYSYSVPNIHFTVENETKNIILEEIDYDISAHFLLTHFINPDGTVWKTAEMAFFRTADDTFYRPKKWVFFKGKPQNGCGIFAFIHLINCENTAQSYGKIYELSEDYNVWKQVINTYIPTVFINGRGNQYESAKATNQAFEGTPKHLEKLNVLNSEFYAYYSTDGYSSVYRLPFSNLDDDRVTCRLYYSSSEYTEWIIEEGQTEGDAILYGVAVTMHINREKGIVNFKVPAGDYEIPLISDRNENNLRFSAHKSGEFTANDVTAGNLAVCANQKILLANGSTVFESDYNNPLYFPLDSVICLGDKDAPVTALSVFSDEFIAFKEDETYKISVKKGKALNSISLLADNDAVFYQNDSVSQECISKRIGCPHKESVINLDYSLLWRGGDGRFYALSKALNINCISNGINSYIDANLNPTAKTFGISQKNANIFLFENGALVMQQSIKDPQWYYWEFPSSISFSGTFNGTEMPRILCCNTEDNICYLAELSGGGDTVIKGNIFAPFSEEVPIKSVIKTVGMSLGCRNTLKNITSVMLCIKAKKAKIRLNDRLEAELLPNERIDEYRYIRLAPGLCTTTKLNIFIESESPIALGNIDIQYTELGF